MTIFQRTLDLLRQSFALLWQDKEILAFPALNGLVCVLVSIVFFLPVYPQLSGISSKTSILDVAQYVDSKVLLWIFLWQITCSSVLTLFDSALVAYTLAHFSDSKMTVMNALSAIPKRIDCILLFLLMTFVMKNLRSFIGWIGSPLWIGWALITGLLLPVLMSEDLGILASIGRSRELLVATWGEQMIGRFVLWTAAFALAVPGCLAGVIGWESSGLVGALPAALYLVATLVVTDAVGEIFNVRLYRQAASNNALQEYAIEIPEGIPEDDRDLA